MVKKKLDFKQFKPKISTGKSEMSPEHFFSVFNSRIINPSNDYINRKEILAKFYDNLDVNNCSQSLKVIQEAKIETSIFINTQKKALNLLKKNDSILVFSIYNRHLTTVACNNIKTALKESSLYLS